MTFSKKGDKYHLEVTQEQLDEIQFCIQYVRNVRENAKERMRKLREKEKENSNKKPTPRVKGKLIIKIQSDESKQSEEAHEQLESSPLSSPEKILIPTPNIPNIPVIPHYTTIPGINLDIPKTITRVQVV